MARELCRGKRRFKDKDQALQALRLIERNGKVRQRNPKRVYECPECRGYHLTAKTVEEYAEAVEELKLPAPPPLPQPQLPRRRCPAARRLKRRHGRPRGR